MRLLVRASGILNAILFGSHVKSETSGLAQWSAIIFYYTINLPLVFIVVAALFAASGKYQPFVAPLARPALDTVLATTNLATFALMYIASFGWEMNEAAIGPQRAARPPRIAYWVLVAGLAAICLFLAGLLFVSFGFATLASGVVMSATLLLIVWSRRVLGSARGALNE